MFTEVFEKMKPIHGTNVARKMALNAAYKWQIESAESVDDLKDVLNEVIDMLLPEPTEEDWTGYIRR